jgi:hypothetical protein
MQRSLVTQSRQHALSERGHDLYDTPPEATRALMRAEVLPFRIWEPACGRGAIVRVLRAAGYQVVASDLVDRGPGYWSRDFLLERCAPAGTECILTNPPYKQAAAFVRHALNLCPKVIFLLRLAFLEALGAQTFSKAANWPACMCSAIDSL